MFTRTNRHLHEITAKLRTSPTTPDETLDSRRPQPVDIRGETIVFPLDEESTLPEFVQTIRLAQNEILTLVRKDAGHIGKTWSDKEKRRQEKFYKTNKKLHLTLFGVTLPCTKEEYKEDITLRNSIYPEYLQEVNGLLNQLLNKDTPISGSVIDCRLNEDGHMVVCIEMNSDSDIPECRKILETYFDKRQYQYNSPEKCRLLHAVIGVVDYRKLSENARESLSNILKQLASDLKQYGPIPINNIEWIEYKKRTLSENSRLSVTTLKRAL